LANWAIWFGIFIVLALLGWAISAIRWGTTNNNSTFTQSPIQIPKPTSSQTFPTHQPTLIRTLPIYKLTSNSLEYCPNALPSKLKIGNRAEVIYFQLGGRLTPGFSSPIEHVLAQGQIVEIMEGPHCADSAWWWKIHFAGTISNGQYLDYEAWMPEVDYDTYYLKYVP